MTLDDLVTLYEVTKGTGPEWVSGDDAVAAVRNLRREKLAAVVKALRDDACRDCRAQLDKILGDDDKPAVCDVCHGTGFIYVRTMHDPDGEREKEVCEECHTEGET